MKRLFYLMLLWGSIHALMAQNRTVSGVISDAMDGSGIPGATVTIVGTGNGTISDIDGHYSLTLTSDGQQLQYSFMGMESQVIPVDGRQVIDVAMSSSSIAVEELVVVGFGAQKKESVVGSVVQAKGDELLKSGTVANVTEALSGILPGVSTMQGSGQPGDSEATVLIRGQSTWNNNSPLFMVDGVERDFNDLDPNEIESISVLKDASATAVFGVKAANGVILITTKRGREGKTTINYSGNWGVKVPVMETDYMEDYATAMQYYSVAAMNDGKYGAIVPQSEIDQWSLSPQEQLAWEADMRAEYQAQGEEWDYKYSDFYSYTNWIDKMIDKGFVQSHNLNISGGGKIVKYFTSFGYNHDGDIFDLEERDNHDPRTSQKRYNWRGNLDFDFTETTRLKVNLSGDYKDWHGNSVTAAWNRMSGGGAEGDNVFNNSFIQRMFYNVQVGTPPVLSNGEMGGGNRYSDWDTYNFYAQLQENGDVTKRSTKMFSDLIFEQEFLLDFLFKAKASYNFERQYLSRTTVDPLYYGTDWRTGNVWQRGDDPDRVETLPRITPEFLSNDGNSLYYELSLSYNKTIAEKHNVSALALFSRRESQYQVAFPSYEESWVGRATYNYKLKYMFEFNGAYNGSENWAPGLRFGFFPSVAMGWTISEEAFFKNNVNVVDYMKLRYSWGQVGNDNVNKRFTYISDYGAITGNSYGTFFYGIPYTQPNTVYFEGVPANKNATWETAVKQNLALETNMFSNRFRAVVDLFNEHRTGILMERQAMPNWFGNELPEANIGETKNHGVEFDFRWNDKINAHWSYYVTANLSLSENRILERDDPKFTPGFQKEAGKPIGWHKGYQQLGYLNSIDDTYNYVQAVGVDRIPGDFVYNDYNADGIIDLEDRVPIANPSYSSNSFAFGFGLSYKQWSMSALFNGAIGLSKYVSPNYLWPYNTTGGDREFRMLKTEMLDYWTPDNQDASSPALHSEYTAYNEWYSNYTVRPSDYLRLKTVELKYTFDKASLHRVPVLSGLEIYANGYNLMTWTKLPDLFDPEAASLEVYPITKRFSMGLRARF